MFRASKNLITFEPLDGFSKFFLHCIQNYVLFQILFEILICYIKEKKSHEIPNYRPCLLILFCDIQHSLKYIHTGQTEMLCSHLGNAYSILYILI